MRRTLARPPRQRRPILRLPGVCRTRVRRLWVIAVSGSDARGVRAMLKAAEGYAVVDREGKRIGLFAELVSDDRIAIRHDGVFVWHRRLLPITTVANVIVEQRAVMLKVDERTLTDTEAPSTSAAETSDIAEEDPPPPDSWQDRIHRYVAPVEGNAYQRDPSHEGTDNQPSRNAEATRFAIAGETDQPRSEPGRSDQRVVERHLLFISTPAG